jgi:RNA polymerase sigma factor (sigma-70 family)
MHSPFRDSADLQDCVDRLAAGHEDARDELLSRACARLTNLTRAMLKDFPSVHRWEETDDVFQNAAMRLCSALKSVTPQTVPELIRLAALQIRRELIDLARHYYGPEGHGARHGTKGGQMDESQGSFEPQQSTFDPSRLAMWTEFHEGVNQLSEESREVFDLLWYQGLSQSVVAQMLGVTERTVQRRWQRARLDLFDMVRGNLPELL